MKRHQYQRKIPMIKRIMAGLLSLLLTVGVFQWDMLVNAAEYVQAVFSEELSEDKASSDVTITVSKAAEDVEIVRIETPDGTVQENAVETTYHATENGDYEFTVVYRVGEGSETEETFSYTVSDIEDSGNTEDKSQDTEENAPAKAPRAAGDVTINSTNFPDEAFRNFLLDQEYGADGVIRAAEIENITVIELPSGVSSSYGYVESLEGIKYFTNLKELECNNNNLLSIDVSENTALERLEIDYNELISLDVSENINLTDLAVSYNSIASLDVSRNINLEWLRCGGNDLSELDLSNNPALQYLNVGRNQLKELDVSDNPELYHLECRYNQLTELDLSENPEISTLYCDNNQLTELNLANNKEVYSLQCDNNRLTQLDFSPNTALRWLECQDNELESLIINSSRIEEINCSGNKLTNIECADASSLTEFDGSSQTPEVGLYEDRSRMRYRSVAGIFPESTTITNSNIRFDKDSRYIWSLSNSGISNVGFTAYPFEDQSLGALTGTMNLTYSESGFTIDELNFPDENFRNFLLEQDYGKDRVITNTELTGITEINCSGRGIEDLTGIGFFTSLITLDCSDNNLTELDVSSNTVLRNLYCSDNELTSLVTGNSQTLNYLDCQRNHLTNMDLSGQQSIGTFFAGGQTITAPVEYNRYIHYYTESGVLEPGTELIQSDGATLGDDGSITINNILQTPSVRFSLGVLESHYSGYLQGTVTFSYVKDITVKGGIITQTEAQSDDASAVLSENDLISGYPSYMGDTVTATPDNTRNFSEGVLGKYRVTYTWSDLPDGAHEEERDVYIVRDDSVISSDRSQSIYAGDITINADDVITAEEVLTESAPEYTYVGDETSYVSTDIADFSISEEDIDKVNQSENDSEVITVTHTASGLSKEVTVQLERFTGVWITEEYFPDENFRNYILEQENWGVDDNFLSLEELAAITEIDCSNRGIWDLAGIEYFTALERLTCTGNHLTTIKFSKEQTIKALFATDQELIVPVTPINPYQYQTEPGVFKGSNSTYMFSPYSIRIDSEGRAIVGLNVGYVEYSQYILTGVPEEGSARLEGTAYFEGFGLLIIKQNFPDDNFRAWLLEQSWGQDRLITDGEMSTITSMNCAGEEIADLTGIQYFTSLNTLDCSGNSLTSLNLNGMSALDDLYCQNNNISSINLTGCTLENADISGNSIREIECTASVFQSQENFRGSNQSLSITMTYDLGSGKWKSTEPVFNTALNPRLPSGAALGAEVDEGGYILLDSTDNPASTVFETANASEYDLGYQLSGTVAFSYPEGIVINEKNFPDENFRNVLLELEEGKDGFFTVEEIAGITTLNCQGKRIKDLTGINYFTALETLNCNANELTSLNIAYLENLRVLYCAHNELISLSFGRIRNLAEIDCGFNHLKTVPSLGVMSNLYKFEGRNQTLVFPVTYDTEDAVYKTAEFVLESGTAVTGDGISFDDIFCQISLETVTTETQANFSLKVANTYTPNLEGTITFTNVQDITVKDGIVTESEAKQGADAENLKNLGLITANPEEAADTVTATVGSDADFAAGKSGDYDVTYEWTDIPDGSHSEQRMIRVVWDGSVISDDRSQSIYASNITVNASKLKDITVTDLLTECAPEYNKIDSSGGSAETSLGAFSITEDDLAKVRACGGGEVQITVSHTGSGMEKEITVHINPDEPTALVIIPKEIELEKTEGSRTVEASAESSVKVAPGLGADVVTEDITIMSDATFVIRNEEDDRLNCNIYVDGKKFGGSLVEGRCRLAVLNVSGKQEQAFEIRAMKDEQDPNTRGIYTGIMNYTVRYGE